MSEAIKRKISPIEIPFTITIRGRKARRGVTTREFLERARALDAEILAAFNDIDLSGAELGDIVQTASYEVVAREELVPALAEGPARKRHYRSWAEPNRRPFRLEYHYMFRFTNPNDIARIRAQYQVFVAGLNAVIQFDANQILEDSETLDDPLFSHNADDYSAEGTAYAPMMKELKNNIRARTVERLLAKLPLPQNLIREEIAKRVATRRRGSASRLRPLPAALTDAAIEEAAKLRPPSKSIEIRPASPTTRRTPKGRASIFSRLFTRRNRGARVAPAPSPGAKIDAARTPPYEAVVPVRPH